MLGWLLLYTMVVGSHVGVGKCMAESVMLQNRSIQFPSAPLLHVWLKDLKSEPDASPPVCKLYTQHLEVSSFLYLLLHQMGSELGSTHSHKLLAFHHTATTAWHLSLHRDGGQRYRPSSRAPGCKFSTVLLICNKVPMPCASSLPWETQGSVHEKIYFNFSLQTGALGLTNTLTLRVTGGSKDIVDSQLVCGITVGWGQGHIHVPQNHRLTAENDTCHRDQTCSSIWPNKDELIEICLKSNINETCCDSSSFNTSQHQSSINSSVCPSVHPSITIPICLTIHPFIHPFIHFGLWGTKPQTTWMGLLNSQSTPVERSTCQTSKLHGGRGWLLKHKSAMS